MQAGERTPLVKKDENPHSFLGTMHLLGYSVCGMLCPGVNLTLINLVLTMLVVESPLISGLLSTSTVLGQLFGQFVFGPLVDLRPKAAVLMSAALGVLGSFFAASAGYFGHVMSLEVQLLIGRVIVGFGTGGEYPAVASLSKKAAGEQYSQRQLMVFSTSFLFLGNIAVQLLYLMLIATSLPHETVWRLLLVAGGLPSLGCFILRLRQPADVCAERPPQHADDSADEAYASLLKKCWEERKLPYLLALCAWTLSHIVFQLLNIFSAVFVTGIIGSDVSHSTLLEYEGWEATVQALMCLLGVLCTPPLLRHASIERVQSVSMLGSAALIMLQIVLDRDMDSTAVLVINGLNQFPQGIMTLTCYTIVIEVLPVQVVGSFISLAVVVLQVAGTICLILFPIFVDKYGIGAAELTESLLLFAGSVATMLLQGSTRNFLQNGDEELSKSHLI
eukprot:TRINITY_DN23542_c0_g1_i1.p1 TRINITY_DN23542_c0_g1~~TRINITY_DN23542_c0_g1_i1.p1  ORF type:complete len:447 (+),score=68.94 TRINITY_DN23542_c0_g1_i1:109-1449(+)